MKEILKADIDNILNSRYATFLLGIIFGISLSVAALHVPKMVAQEETTRVTVVTCENCSYGRFRNTTDDMFDTSYDEVSYKSSRGQRHVEKYNLNYVPAFVFDKSVENVENFSRVRTSLVEFEDAYVISDAGRNVAQRFSSGKQLEGSPGAN